MRVGKWPSQLSPKRLSKRFLREFENYIFVLKHVFAAVKQMDAATNLLYRTSYTYTVYTIHIYIQLYIQLYVYSFFKYS